jgi:hypothetical protein
MIEWVNATPPSTKIENFQEEKEIEIEVELKRARILKNGLPQGLP